MLRIPKAINTAIFASVVYGVIGAGQCLAQSEGIDTPSSSQQDEGMVDEVHAGVSRSVLATAQWLDSFFDDRRVEGEANKSRLKLSFTGFAEEGELLGYDFKFRLRLAFPRMKDKLNLIISGDPEDDISFDDESQRNIRARIEEGRTDGGVAALQYFIRAARDRNISLKAGLRFSGITPVLFLGPRFRQSIALNDWTLRFTQRIRWFTDKGWDSNTRFDLERPLLDRFFLRNTTEGIWRQEESGYFYNYRMLLFQPLNESKSLSYEWNNLFQTAPNNRLQETNLRLRYRWNFWRKWLFFDVAPQVAFLKDRDFNISPGIIFRLEALFGYYKGG